MFNLTIVFFMSSPNELSIIYCSATGSAANDTFVIFRGGKFVFFHFFHLFRERLCLPLLSPLLNFKSSWWDQIFSPWCRAMNSITVASICCLQHKVVSFREFIAGNHTEKKIALINLSINLWETSINDNKITMKIWLRYINYETIWYNFEPILFPQDMIQDIYKLHWNITHKSTGVTWNVGLY